MHRGVTYSLSYFDSPLYVDGLRSTYITARFGWWTRAARLDRLRQRELELLVEPDGAFRAAARSAQQRLLAAAAQPGPADAAVAPACAGVWLSELNLRTYSALIPT